MRYRQHLILSKTASTMLLLLMKHADLGLALQPNPSPYSSSSLLPRGHVSSDCPTRCFLGSLGVDNIEHEGKKQTITYDWDEQFEELQLFKSEYGHCYFPQNASLELTRKYPKLERFCDDQRLDYRLHREGRSGKSESRMSLARFDRDIRLRRLEEIGFEFMERAARWHENYYELVEFHSLHGNCLVKQVDSEYLYQWVFWQRVKFREGGLSETQIDLLNRIDFPWEGYYHVGWMDMYNELVAYQKKHDHLQVTWEDNTSLLYWIQNQRKKRMNLSEEQRMLLDDINFPWVPRVHETTWSNRYNKLVNFKKKHGHLLVELDGELYRWMHYQRQRYARKPSMPPLSDEQMQLLDDIDFPWQPPRVDARWNKRYNELTTFREKHGHCRPTTSKHLQLYGWSASQRKKNAQGLLSAEQIALLDKIDFPWEQNEKEFWRMYNQLCSFVTRHGHLRVSQEEDPDLYDWVELQRQQYHGMTEPALSDNLVERLEDAHFCWSLDWKERAWHEKYTEVVEFFKEHGHVRVTKKENLSLYNWIDAQGKRYKELEGTKPLSSEELEMLEQVDFDFLEGQPHMAWNAMFSELKRYRQENDGRLPTCRKDDPDLNCWMRQQRLRLRCAYGYAPLSDQQKSLLKSIDFSIYPKSNQLRKWYEKYDEVVDFWKQHGHFLVDRSKNAILYMWIERQRLRYHGRSIQVPPLSKLQVYLFERIGFAWTSKFDEMQWQETYEELVEFLEARGRFPTCTERQNKLYQWMSTQRTRRKPDNIHTFIELSESQIQQLDKIGFRW